MKTIITQNIDGYDVVIDLDNADKIIDPETTKVIVDKEITKTEIYKNIEQIKNQMQVYANQAYQAIGNAKKAKNKSDIDKFSLEWRDRNAQVKELQVSLKPLAVQFESEYRSLMKKHAIYFNPAPYEEIITDEQAETIKALMIEATQEGCVVDKTGTKIADNRGKVYFKNTKGIWTRQEISKLGDTPLKGSIELKDLTSEQQVEISKQVEAERISGMTSNNKSVELENIIAGLKQQAISMRSGLEIDGDSKALVKAQEWLADEIGKAEVKYA
jgi:hypothetical protein